MLRVTAKWGFGNAPLKKSHREKTEAAIRIVLHIFEHLPNDPTIDDLAAISHVKGQFTRTLTQDQWDWSTVWHLLGRPSRRFANAISNNLGKMRVALKHRDLEAAAEARNALISMNILKYLAIFLSEPNDALEDTKQNGSGGYIYILSTRSLPTLLKIGMTRRSVEIRAKEVNSATGVIIPFGVRASWRVDNAREVEQQLHSLLAEYRVRNDREFFEIKFSHALEIINDYLQQRRADRRNGLHHGTKNDGTL